MIAWLLRVRAWIAALFKGDAVGVTHRGEVVIVPEIPVAPLDMTSLPGVQTAIPPLEHLASITAAVERFATATLQPGANGGLVTVWNMKPDGSKHFNLAITQRTGEKAVLVGWVGKTWNGPLPGGWETGLAWKKTW